MKVEGMTLRDYFAAQAMVEFLKLDIKEDPDIIQNKCIAEMSYYLADDMIKARNDND